MASGHAEMARTLQTEFLNELDMWEKFVLETAGEETRLPLDSMKNYAKRSLQQLFQQAAIIDWGAVGKDLIDHVRREMTPGIIIPK